MFQRVINNSNNNDNNNSSSSSSSSGSNGNVMNAYITHANGNGRHANGHATYANGNVRCANGNAFGALISVPHDKVLFCDANFVRDATFVWDVILFHDTFKLVESWKHCNTERLYCGRSMDAPCQRFGSTKNHSKVP